jgi:hypothetical protein
VVCSARSRLGETHEVRGVAYNFFAPVRAVWLGIAPDAPVESAVL